MSVDVEIEAVDEQPTRWCRCDHLDTEHHLAAYLSSLFAYRTRPCTVLIVPYGGPPRWCRCLNFTTAKPVCHRCGHKANRHDKHGVCTSDDRCPCNDYLPAEDPSW